MIIIYLDQKVWFTNRLVAYFTTLVKISHMIVTIKVLLFVDRNLTDNELKELSKGVFDNNTQLVSL